MTQHEHLMKAFDYSQKILDILSDAGFGGGDLFSNQKDMSRRFFDRAEALRWPNSWVAAPNGFEYTTRDGVVYLRAGDEAHSNPPTISVELIDTLHAQLHPEAATKPTPDAWAVENHLGEFLVYPSRESAERAAVHARGDFPSFKKARVFALFTPDQVPR